LSPIAKKRPTNKRQKLSMKENLFMRAEDDLDFMPIIPLNENDNENLNDIEIPKELPVLP